MAYYGEQTSQTKLGRCLLMSLFVLLVKHTPRCSATIELKFAGSCDFETEDLCGYVQGDRDDFNWKRRSGPTPSRETGPEYDHTLGQNRTGHYMFIEGTGVHAWNAAHLISPSLAPLQTYCLRFFYHMYGKDTGQLNVRVVDEARPEQPGDVVWTMLWEQGNHWLNASVDVTCASGCKLSFQAKPGNGFWSDTAIDDVTVINGSCFPEDNTTTSTTRASTSDTLTSTEDPDTDSSTDAGTQTMQSASSTLEYEIIEYKYDENFITIILAVGLTFWTVVFGIIFILFCFCDRRQNGGQTRGINYDVRMEPSHPEKQAINKSHYVEIEERGSEEIAQTYEKEDDTGSSSPKPDRTAAEDGVPSSDESSVDSDPDRYSIPVITTPKPPRGPSPPCAYMSLDLDTLNNNGEYQPLNSPELTEIPV